MSASLTTSGQILPYIFARSDQLCVLLDQRIRAQEFFLVTLPDTAKTSRFCSSAQPAVIRVPEYSPASNANRHATYMRLRMGKFCGAANAPMQNSEMRASSRARICSDKREVSFG